MLCNLVTSIAKISSLFFQRIYQRLNDLLVVESHYILL